jgi:hypothetical protein
MDTYGNTAGSSSEIISRQGALPALVQFAGSIKRQGMSRDYVTLAKMPANIH